MNYVDTVWREASSDTWMIRGHWSERWCIIPRRCRISGKLLWLRRAYRGRLLLLGPGGADFETRWHCRDEHLLWVLTR